MKSLKLITICVVVGMLLTAGADVKGSVTRLLLHFDEDMNDYSGQNHPITPNGNVQLDTTEKKSGTASLLLADASDYLTSADSPDWDILADNTDCWTIDFFVLHDSLDYQYYLGQVQGGTLRWGMYYDEGGIAFYGGSSGISLAPAGPISDDLWHWIVFCKVGSNYGMYLDGNQVNYLSSTNTGDYNGMLEIGTYAGTYSFNGNMDELRITHDNIYSAEPSPDLQNQINNPEPATICLLGLGALSLLRKKHA